MTLSDTKAKGMTISFLKCAENDLSMLSLGHTRSRDHRIARLVTNLGDVRLVATTKDQSLGLSTVYRYCFWKKCIL